MPGRLERADGQRARCLASWHYPGEAWLEAMISQENLSVAISAGRTVTAIWTSCEEATQIGWSFVYAPGAGSNLHDPFGMFAAEALAKVGIATLRFQFPYMEAGKRIPDWEPVLEATWLSAIEAARERSATLVLGGRSMGGRIASQVVATGADVGGLALFAYPLHPPGKPDDWRDRPFPLIGVPTFFCSGTNDPFASPDELRIALAKIPGAQLHLLDTADHGFNVRKRDGRSREDVWREAIQAFERWLFAILH